MTCSGLASFNGSGCFCGPEPTRAEDTSASADVDRRAPGGDACLALGGEFSAADLPALIASAEPAAGVAALTGSS
jgi:hypothetical protein